MKMLSETNVATLATSRTYSPTSTSQLASHSPLTRSYWQEQLDAGKFSQSIVLDPVSGFGGDGSGRGNCITTGPFANYTNHIGPGYQLTDHCIDRRINNQISTGSSQGNVNQCLQQSSFATAWSCIEGMPHAGGHAGVGGQVSSVPG